MNCRALTIRLSLLLAVAAAVAPAGATQSAAPASASAPASSIDAATRKRVIDTAIARITKEYVFPDKVPAIAKALRAGLAGKYRAISDPQAFTDAVNADLEAVANDRHLHLLWSADPQPPPRDPDKVDPAMRRKFEEFMAQRNYAIREAKVLDGNLGYLKINGFLPAEQAGPTLAAAMAFLQNSDALIIDLRDNGGGSPKMVTYMCSYLFSQRTHVNDLWTRRTNSTEEFWTHDVPGKRLADNRPVYVLTSKRTFSGGEEFTYDLKNLKRATIVGETTGGGAHPVSGQRIDEHFIIGVPFARAISPITKTNWEGTGVEPDVKVPAAQALTTAQKLAAEKKPTT